MEAASAAIGREDLRVALRCQKIVQNLLAFARQHPRRSANLGLNGTSRKTSTSRRTAEGQ